MEPNTRQKRISTAQSKVLVHTVAKYFNAKQHFIDVNAKIISKYIISQQIKLLSSFDARHAG